MSDKGAVILEKIGIDPEVRGQLSFQWPGVVGSLLGAQIMRDRNGNPTLDQGGGLPSFLIRDQVDGAEHVVLAPASPVRVLLEKALEFRGRHFGWSGAVLPGRCAWPEKTETESQHTSACGCQNQQSGFHLSLLVGSLRPCIRRSASRPAPSEPALELMWFSAFLPSAHLAASIADAFHGRIG